MANSEKIKHRKTGIVIIIASILVLIMHMYILSALLFLLGIIVILSPFKTDTIELNGTSTDDEDCKYRNCNDCDEIDDEYCNEDKNDSVDNKDDIDSQIDISEGEVDILPSAETEIETDIDTLPSTETEIEPDVDVLPSDETEIKADTEKNIDDNPIDSSKKDDIDDSKSEDDK